MSCWRVVFLLWTEERSLLVRCGDIWVDWSCRNLPEAIRDGTMRIRIGRLTERC